jgi:transcriptional regulator with XRE-family HTH domain
MGRSPRYIPKHLGRKLFEIRRRLEIETYDEMLQRLNVQEVKLHRATILRYEAGKLEPPSIVLLKYARLAGIMVDDLIDDAKELPKP